MVAYVIHIVRKCLKNSNPTLEDLRMGLFVDFETMCLKGPPENTQSAQSTQSKHRVTQSEHRVILGSNLEHRVNTE